MRFFSIILVILVTLLSPTVLVVNAQQDSRGLILNPSIQELQAERGKDYSLELNIENGTEDQEYDVNFIKQTFQSTENEGEPRIVDFNKNDNTADWIGTPTPNFTLKSKQTQNFELKISIPQNASPGSYYYALTFEAKNNNNPSNANLIINQRLVSLLFVQVQGQVKREAKFVSFSPNLYLVDPIFDNFSFNYKIQVDGNSYLKPAGNIFSYTNKDQPDFTLDLNPERKILLPNTARNFDQVSKSSLQIPILTSGQNIPSNAKSIDINRPWFGNKNVEISMTYSNSEGQLVKNNATINVWFIPWKLILICCVAIILIVLIGWLLKERYKSKI